MSMPIGNKKVKTLYLGVYEERIAFMNQRDAEEKPSATHLLPTSISFWADYVKTFNSRKGHKSYFKATKNGTVIEAAFKSADNWWRILSKKYVPPNKSLYK